MSVPVVAFVLLYDGLDGIETRVLKTPPWLRLRYPRLVAHTLRAMTGAYCVGALRRRCAPEELPGFRDALRACPDVLWIVCGDRA